MAHTRLQPCCLLCCALLLGASGAAAQDEPPIVHVEDGAAEDPPLDEAASRGDADADSTDGADDDDSGPKVRGNIRAKVRERWTSDESDTNGYLGLTLELRPTRGVELYFSGDLFGDLGHHKTDRNLLFDVWDTWDSEVQGRVQEAYVRLIDGVPGLDLRLGRQLHVRSRTVQFDGVSAEYVLTPNLRAWALGGVPVYFYKSPWRGDVVAGGGLELSPSRWTWLGLDYYHGSENAAGRTGFVHDDLFVLSGRQNLGRYVQLRSMVDVLSDELRSAEAGATINLPTPFDAQLRGRYRVLFKRQLAQTTSFDPFSGILGPEEPHHQVDVSAWKGLGEHAAVEVFYTYRGVRHDADSSPTNLDYHRYGATLRLFDVLVEGLDASATVESWDVVGPDGTDTRQASGEVSYRANDVVTVSAGSSYQLLVWDAFDGRQREDVRIWFAKLRLDLGPHRFDAQYSFEHDDLADFHTVRLGYRYDF